MLRATYIFLLTLFLFGCNDDEPKENVKVDWTKEQSSNLSKNLAEQQEIDIKLFLEMRKDWNVIKTGSGLIFSIYDSIAHPINVSPKYKDVASIEYTVTLLDGSLCYKTEVNEYENLIVDKSEVESGMQEALKRMRVGDKAHLIIPSHIGHGLLGDFDKIPPLTPIVVDLHLIDLK